LTALNLPMLRRLPSHACLVVLALILVVLDGSQLRAGSVVDGWEDGPYAVPDQATWAAHYRANARVRLGPEQRLPNGVGWRLHVDVGTRLAMPRIAWMPDAQSMLTANDMLDMVQGGAMMFADAMRQWRDDITGSKRHKGDNLPQYDRPVVQTDVGLTYATPTLVSLIDLGLVPDERIDRRIVRGLTFDLRTREIFRTEACLGSDGVYGTQTDYLFQFGKLLQVCDHDTYVEFVQLLKTKAGLVADQVAGSRDPAVAWCSEKAGPFIDRYQEIALYLTFQGLAVHNTEYWPKPRRSDCVLKRSLVNPVIVPYRELEPFMIPGAWRDELLRLH